MERGQVPAAIAGEPGDPFHAEKVVTALGVGAAEVRRHRVGKRALESRMEPDLRRQLGVRHEGDHRLLGQAQSFVEGRHRRRNISGIEVKERAIRGGGHKLRV